MRHRNAKITLATVAITGVVGAGVAVAADAPTCPYSNTPKAAQNAPAQGERQRSRNCGRASETPARTRSLPPRREPIEHARGSLGGTPGALHRRPAHRLKQSMRGSGSPLDRQAGRFPGRREAAHRSARSHDPGGPPNAIVSTSSNRATVVTTIANARPSWS